MVVDQGKRVVSSDLGGEEEDILYSSAKGERRKRESGARRKEKSKRVFELTREMVVCIPRVPFRPEA